MFACGWFWLLFFSAPVFATFPYLHTEKTPSRRWLLASLTGNMGLRCLWIWRKSSLAPVLDMMLLWREISSRVMCALPCGFLSYFIETSRRSCLIHLSTVFLHPGLPTSPKAPVQSTQDCTQTLLLLFSLSYRLSTKLLGVVSELAMSLVCDLVTSVPWKVTPWCSMLCDRSIIGHILYCSW